MQQFLADMSESVRPERSSPQDGDVVVTEDRRSAVQYTVSRFPGPAQFTASERPVAIASAREFAREYAVDLWYSAAETYRLLEAYRPRS